MWKIMAGLSVLSTNSLFREDSVNFMLALTKLTSLAVLSFHLHLVNS